MHVRIFYFNRVSVDQTAENRTELFLSCLMSALH